MTDAARVRASQVMAGYAVLGGAFGAGSYLYLGLSSQMFTDWVALNAVFGPLFGVVSMVVLRRQLRNRAVWALAFASVLMSTQALSLGFLQFRLAGLGIPSTLAHLVPADLPVVAAIQLQTSAWIWITTIYVFCLAVLVFPDGRLPGTRWSAVGRGIVAAMVFATAVAAWIARPSSTVAPYSEAPFEHLPPLLAGLYGAGLLALGISLTISVGGLVVRYRSSPRQVRMQIRWIAWAGALFVVQFVVLFPLQFTPVGMGPFRYSMVVTVSVFIGAYVVAITRYRLYEIDRIISRTVSYGSVTAVLVGVYVGAVLGAQTLFGVTGGERSPTIVAGSTLLVAALFQPLRRRVQTVVDERFNRRVYDATRTIAEFAGRLRDDVETESLVHDLRGAIAGIVEPTAVSVWLKSTDPGG